MPPNKYIVIIPAYDEEKYIGEVLDCLVAQTLLPTQIIVVDDCSRDGTAEIVQKFEKEYHFVKLVRNEKREPYASGSKVVRAFYLGYKAIDKPYDYIAKIDADLEVDTDYFETLIEVLNKEPEIGIAGGLIQTFKNDQWVYENFSDKDHVKGAYKFYRRACFEDIGGLKPSIGWDTLDELLAIKYGWKIKVLPELKVKHHRPLGSVTGFVKIRKRIGNGFYRMRYGFWISLISSLKTAFRDKPYIISGIVQMYGWMSSYFKREKFIVSGEEGKFIRRFRRGKMIFKLKKYLSLGKLI